MVLRRRESGCRGGEQGYEGDDELGHGWKLDLRMGEEQTKGQTKDEKLAGGDQIDQISATKIVIYITM